MVTVCFFGIFSLTTSRADSGEKVVLRAAGCKTEYFLIQDLARGYKNRGNVAVMPQKTGNKVAIKLLATDKIDFAFTCKPHPKLVKKFKIDDDIANHWVTEAIANDPVVIVVNRKNSVISLSLDQVRDIFSGKIKNWQEVGGNDMKVTVAYLDKTVESGVLTVFQEQVNIANKSGTPVVLCQDAIKAAGPKKLGAIVSQNEGALAFMGLNSYRRRYGSLVNINGIPPNRENILNDSYPISVTYHIVYDKRDKARIQPFLDYIASEEGQSIANQSFVSRVNK